MASIKVKFRPSVLENNEGTIFYQIIQERKVRQLLTEYRIFPFEWDEVRGRVTPVKSPKRKSYILSIREKIRWDLERINKIIRKFDNDNPEYTPDEIIDEFNRYAAEYTLFNFMQNIIVKLKRNGKVRTSETYTSTLLSFKKFRNGQDIMLDSLNTQIMEEFEAWHAEKGNTRNTISFYMRVLRAVYKRAVDNDIIDDKRPFRHVYTGIEKTAKRAISLQIIKKIKDLDLKLNSSLDYARDMFMLSFMLRGMSFIDMAFLKKSDLKNGYIIYRRRKTGQQLSIAWTKEMQRLLEKYPENETQFLFPIIRHLNSNERYVYRNVAYKINYNLKKIANMVGVSIPLTLYVARHSWASVAKAKGIPLSVISEGMGHDSELTTQIYLASLDTSVVDHANSIILNSL
ncbi:MAG: site-specific integrase [Bacteroides sp.]|nr:site-specific integrase [Bacteroides sp.]